jgi:hypothetical protein
MITLDLARAHIRDLHREAERERAGIGATPVAGRLRRLVTRRHANR